MGKKLIREDQFKVPDDFPNLKCRSRIYSEGGKCYMPYYKAEEVWKWFSSRLVTIKFIGDKKDKMRAVQLE